MIIVTDIRLPATANPETDAPRAAIKLAGLSGGEVKSSRLRRFSADARHGRLSYVCSAVLELKSGEREREICGELKNASPFERVALSPERGVEPLSARPIVAGFGPAGMFAACLLAEYGFNPLVLERGADVDGRAAAVGRFWGGGPLDPETNVQFGAGGAGAFSDGKLVSRINDPLCDYVLERLCGFGAPRDIMFKAKPHVGTDLMRGVICRVRDYIRSNGGEVRFLSRVDGITVSNGAVTAIRSGGESIACGALVLACGHSARDTFEMLKGAGLKLKAKPFSVGARIEHPQALIDRAMYGKNPGADIRGEYALSCRAGGRAVYTFCMCPGGSVIAASSEEGGVVTNGMSMHLRDGANANAAVAVSVSPADFGGDPFKAVEFQRALERRAFSLAGKSYRAPAQTVKSFLESQGATLSGSSVEPSYLPGVEPRAIEEVLGRELCGCLREGILAFDKRLRGFSSDGAVLTAPETRTSSPVRIQRDKSGCAEGVDRLYPSGEGAGYAGGIMSAAVDGLKTAVRIIERFKPV